MISRATAHLLGEIHWSVFATAIYSSVRGYTYLNNPDEFYDYLYTQEYDAWFCNRAKKLKKSDERAIKEFIMKLHTGETVEAPNWTWAQRRELGQRLLLNLAQDVLNNYSVLEYSDEEHTSLLRCLELDGYEYKEGRLLYSESTVLDEETEAGVLENLYKTLNLDNSDITLHHLELSSENYLAGHWGDAISNARCFLEHTLREIYVSHNLEKHNALCNPNVYSRPVEVRKYLEQEGLIEPKETKAIAEIYGLLSNTGSHPYIAEKDQARLMRHLALTFSQFAMLRYQGYLKSKGK